MYNSPLPPPPQHQPHLSFDTEGRYEGNIDELVAPLCKENIPQEEGQLSIQEAARDAAKQPLVGSEGDFNPVRFELGTTLSWPIRCSGTDRKSILT